MPLIFNASFVDGYLHLRPSRTAFPIGGKSSLGQREFNALVEIRAPSGQNRLGFIESDDGYVMHDKIDFPHGRFGSRRLIGGAGAEETSATASVNAWPDHKSGSVAATSAWPGFATPL